MVKNNIRYLSLSQPIALPDIGVWSTSNGNVTMFCDLSIESLVGREDSSADVKINQVLL
jgi:hypothetical protein